MAEESLDSILNILLDTEKIEEIEENLKNNVLYAIINLEAKKEKIPAEMLPALYALNAEKLDIYDSPLADEVAEYYTKLYKTRITEMTNKF